MLKKTGFISQDTKEQILKANDIAQLIGEYVQLKPAGKNLIGLCPFHQEKTPSFTVSHSYQSFKCYGCGEYGDAIRFVMGIENLQFVEAVHFLAKRSGISIETSNDYSPKVSNDSIADNCLEKSLTFFLDNLARAQQTSEIREYLKKRDISESLVEKFQLGYAPPGWTNLNSHLLNLNFSNLTQEKVGLIKEGEKGGHYDRLRNRLIFPIKDRRGILLGFAGRAIGDEEPKYLNPPETDLYKKSFIFYGIDLAYAHIRRNRRAILVEGYLDVIRLHENEWFESIATCGTALTKEHIGILKLLGAEEAILLFDGDGAGIKAAERSARLFIENDLDSKVIILPEGLDPDDYFKKFSNKDFNRLLADAAYDFDFIISRTKQDFTKQDFSLKGIQYRESKIREVIGGVVNNIKSTIKKELFLSNAAKSFDIAKGKLLQIIKQPETRRETSDTQPVNSSFPIFEKEQMPEVRFLQYLMNHAEAIKYVREQVRINDFIDHEFSEIFARFLQLTDNEFELLKAQDFPELFVEYGTKLVYMLHNDFEYKGPVFVRPGSAELLKLKEDNEEKNRTFSQETLKRLVQDLKRNRQLYEKSKMRYEPPEQQMETLRLIIENRKKTV
ncbi:DNA primase [bacterium]|nr:DNA primase [bacterium]